MLWEQKCRRSTYSFLGARRFSPSRYGRARHFASMAPRLSLDMNLSPESTSHGRRRTETSDGCCWPSLLRESRGMGVGGSDVSEISRGAHYHRKSVEQRTYAPLCLSPWGHNGVTKQQKKPLRTSEQLGTGPSCQSACRHTFWRLGELAIAFVPK